MSDVWEPQRAEAEPVQVAEAIPVNQAFSVDVVFRLGWSAVQRQPGLALAAGGALFALQVVPQLVQQFSSLLPDGNEVLQLGFAFGGMALGLVASVAVQFCTAGVMVAFQRFFLEGEADIGTVFTSWRAGLNVLIAMLLVGFAVVLGGLVLFGPGLAAFGYALYWFVTDPSSGQIALPFALGVVWLLLATPTWVYATQFLQLVPVIAALEPIGPVDVLTEAWERTNGARLTLFVLQLVYVFATVLSLCVCLLPLIVLIPTYLAGMTAAWTLVSKPSAELKKLEFFAENAPDLLT